MKVQAGVGVVTAPALGLVVTALVTHIVHHLAGAVLRATHAHVEAHAPVSQPGVGLAPPVHRKTLHEAHAKTGLRGGNGSLQGRA